MTTTNAASERQPSPVPDELADMIDVIDADIDEDVRWYVERLVELAYHDGYAAGHMRGWASRSKYEGRRNNMGSHALDVRPKPRPRPVPAAEPAMSQIGATS